MENLNFGAGFGIIILAYYLFVLIIKAFLSFIIVHFASKSLRSNAAKMLGIEAKLATDSRYDFLAYQTAVLFVAPIIMGVFNWLFNSFFRWGLFNNLFYFGNSFNFCSIYLLSLTIWYYNEGMDKVQMKSFGKISMQCLIFILISMLGITANIYHGRSEFFFNFSSIITYVIMPALLPLITILYIRKNKRIEI